MNKNNEKNMSSYDRDMIEEIRKAKKELDKGKSIMLDVDTFQEKVLAGEICDDAGTALLYINGELSNYNIHIDRHCVTRNDGVLVTFRGMLKINPKENYSILYTPRPKRIVRVY